MVDATLDWSFAVGSLVDRDGPLGATEAPVRDAGPFGRLGNGSAAHQQETWLLDRHYSSGLAMAWLPLIVRLLMSSSAVVVMLLTVTRFAWREEPLALTGSLPAGCGDDHRLPHHRAVALGQRSLGLMREQRRELRANLRQRAPRQLRNVCRVPSAMKWRAMFRSEIIVRVDDTLTVTLWRPTGPAELALVEASGWRAWPPRLPQQPIFYPVLNEEYATTIARDWNAPASGAGYVTRFQVRRAFLDRYEVHQVGGRTVLEYWIPAGDLDAFNANIVGTVEVVAEYR